MSREDRRRKLKEDGIIEINSNSYNNIVTKSMEKQKLASQYNSKLPTPVKSQVDNLYNKNNVQQNNMWERVKARTQKIMDSTDYISQKFSAGIISGVTGIGQSGITEFANNLKIGNEKKGNEIIQDIFSNIDYGVNPSKMYTSLMKKTIKDNINILKNKDSNTLEKGVDSVTQTVSNAINSLPIKKQIDTVQQVVGKIANENASNEMLKLNKKISEPSEKINEMLAEESKNHGTITNYAGDAMQSVGNMGVSIGTTAITGNPAIGLGVMGISAKGQSTQEALNKGMNLQEAINIGNTKGAIEIGTEMLTGGVNIFGKGALDEIVEKGINKKIVNKVLNGLAHYGYDIVGEVSEETISDLLGTIIDKGTVDPNATYGFKDFADTAITTILSTTILNLLTGGLASGNNTQKSGSQQTTIENEQVLNNNQQVIQEQDKNTQIQTSEQMNNTNQNLLSQEENIKTISKKIENNTYKNSENVKTFLESAVNNNLDINSKEIENISKILDNRKLKGSFKSEVFNGDTNKSALYVNGEVVFNPKADSKKGLYDLVIHETSHSMLENNTELKNTILETLKADSRYEQMYNDVASRYSEEYKNSDNFQRDVEEEMIADYLGENLSTEEFITKLSAAEQTKNQSKIKQVIDNFIQKIKEFFTSRFGTGIKETDAEKYYWNKIENLFYDSYLNSENVSNENNKYSFAGVNSKSANYNTLAVAETLERSGKSQQEIYKKTGWYRGNENKWRYEIYDSNFEIKTNIEANKGYNLNSILLNADELYKAYPQLKDAEINFVNLPKDIAGGYSETYDSYIINNNLINNTMELKKTLLHEIQHNIQAIEDFSRGNSDNWQEIKTKVENKLASIDKEIDNINSKIGFEDYKNKLFNEYFGNDNFNSNEYFSKLEEFQNNSKYSEQIQRLKAQKKSLEENYKNIKNRSSDDLYQNTAGEQESFDVEKRLDMSLKERKAQLPFVKNKKTVYNIDNKMPYEFNGDKYELFLKEDIKNGKNGYDINVRNKESRITRDNKHISSSSRTEQDRYFYRQTMESQATNKGEDISNFKRNTSKNRGLENKSSSFSLPKNPDILINTKGRKIDISNLQETSQMRLNNYNRKYNKENITAYRGISENTGNNSAMYGLGLYTTLDKNYASKYGDVEIVDSKLLPENPLKFKTQNDFKMWEQDLASQLGIRYSELLGNDYGIEKYVKKLGYDGLMIGTGKDTDLISFKENKTNTSDAKYSQNTEGEWNTYLKETSRNKENRKTIKELRDAEVINISNNYSNVMNSTVKAQNYEKRKNINFKKEMAEFLGVSRFNKNNKGIFDNAISQIREEYKINGKVSEDTRNYIFDDMYNNLIKEDNNYYNTYKDLKIELENTELNITTEIKKDITDFRDFKREYYNNLNISENNQGIDVDSYYQELNSQYPELFPETIINQSDQLRRIAEVSKSIRKSESNISAYANKYLSKEYKMWAKNEFEEQIDKLVKEYEIVDIYNQDRAKQNIKEEYVRPSTDEIRWIYDNKAKMQKEYEKLNNTTLLTKREKAIVDRLLKDEMDFEEILPGFNKEAIAKVYTAKQQLEYTNNAIKAYKKDVKNNMKELAENLVEGSVNWKDKKHGIQYARETAQRNIQDIMSKEEAERLNAEIFDKVIHNTSEQTRFINNYVEKINKLNIDKSNRYDWKSYNGKNIKINEADLAQLFIEKKIDENALKAFGADVEKVKNIANTFREVLEDTVNQMDNVYINFGYAPIEKRKNYFPHFLENKPDTLMTKIANALQFDINPDNLPTDIAGRTETFKPGRAFNRNILQRTTEKTDYNALKSLDMYIQGASDIIYHTEDIQKIRALNEAIRDKYRDQKTQEKIEQIKENTELTEEERQKQIQAISDAQKTPLNNLVNWLDDYANSLANKKASGDRQMEKDINRQMYTTMKNIEGKIASNLVGGNMSVALTNFAPLAQATGTTKLSNILIGMIQTVQNDINTVHGKNDNFVYESDFLTSRRGSELTQKEKITSKISNILSTPMELIDNFTSESIVRAKYRENVKKGMEHSEALKKADTYARNLMADRSKGAVPILFDRKNPVMKLLTSFQVEPNNTFSNYTKDMVRDSKSNTQLAYQITKLSIASYAFNTLLKSIRGGGDVIPNPIGIVSQLISLATSSLDDDDENDEDPTEVLLSISSDIFGSIPFGSAVASAGVALGVDELSDSGRLMTSSTMPDITKVGKLFDSEVGGEYKKQVIANELTKPLLYLGLPTGGAQLSKTIKGLSSYIKGGSYNYNDKGEKNIQFPIAQNTRNIAKSTLFGKYSTKEGQKYLENFEGLNSKETALYDNSGIDFYELQKYFKVSDEAIVTDENKYSRYLDNKGNEYWYDKENKRLYDKNYNVSNVSIYDLNKDTKKEILTNYIEDMNINLEQKWNLYNFNIFSDTQSENAQYALKNRMTTEEEYIELYKNSLNNDVSMPNEEELTELKENGLNLSIYMDYKTKVKKEQEKVKKQNEQKKKTMLPTKDFKEETFSTSDKIELIKNSNYTDEEKRIIYSNYIAKDDEIYNVILKLEESETNIDEYLDYKIQNFESDENAKSNIVGKKVSKGEGTAKSKTLNYINNSKMTDLEKAYIVETKYSGVLSNKELKQLTDIVKSKITDKEELEDILKRFKDLEKHKDDGKYYSK